MFCPIAEKADLKWRWKNANIIKRAWAKAQIILKESEIKDLKKALKTNDYSQTELRSTDL